jgi:hypothetical protein
MLLLLLLLLLPTADPVIMSRIRSYSVTDLAMLMFLCWFMGL